MACMGSVGMLSGFEQVFRIRHDLLFLSLGSLHAVPYIDTVAEDHMMQLMKMS